MFSLEFMAQIHFQTMVMEDFYMRVIFFTGPLLFSTEEEDYHHPVPARIAKFAAAAHELIKEHGRDDEEIRILAISALIVDGGDLINPPVSTESILQNAYLVLDMTEGPNGHWAAKLFLAEEKAEAATKTKTKTKTKVKVKTKAKDKDKDKAKTKTKTEIKTKATFKVKRPSTDVSREARRQESLRDAEKEAIREARAVKSHSDRLESLKVDRDVDVPLNSVVAIAVRTKCLVDFELFERQARIDKQIMGDGTLFEL
jgi:hypothetical protein